MASSAAGGMSPLSCRAASLRILSIIPARDAVHDPSNLGGIERGLAPGLVPRSQKFERHQRIDMAAQQIAREAGDGVVALAFADTTQNEVAPFRRRRWQRPVAISGLADLGN